MNVAFFLTPMTEVAFVAAKSTMRQAIEKMEAHGYAAIPILDDEGCYLGTLTEGDLLRKMKEVPGLTFIDTERVHLDQVKLRRTVKAVRITTQIEELFHRVSDQNFVPVIDGRGVLMGIVTRRRVIEYCIDLGLRRDED